MFTKYKKEEEGTKILFLYLLLNGYLNESKDENKIQVEIVEEERLFGLKIRKMYGIVDYVVDVKKIEDEINQIVTPIVCSLSSFEYYAESKNIYIYTPEDDRFFINDLGIISKVMVIAKDLVISEVKARDIQEAGCETGFEDFKLYVLENYLKKGDWEISYKDQIFSISYQGNILYSAIEIDKTSTYKLVIYTIKKICQKQDEFPPDQFKVCKYSNTEIET